MVVTQERLPPMDSELMIDTSLLHDLKYRAYNLYERLHESGTNCDLEAELGYVACAASVIQNCSNGNGSDGKGVRAARVYLRALSSFIGGRQAD